MSNYRILVLDPVSCPAAPSQGAGLAAPEGPVESLELDPDRIGRDLSGLVQMVETISEPDDRRFRVSEIELSLAITAEGKLAILGSGFKSSATAGIKVKIERSPPTE